MEMNARATRNKCDNQPIKCGSMDQACERYSLGYNTMRKTAEAAGAIVKVGRRVNINFSIMDDFFDSISG